VKRRQPPLKITFVFGTIRAGREAVRFMSRIVTLQSPKVFAGHGNIYLSSLCRFRQIYRGFRTSASFEALWTSGRGSLLPPADSP
jgi:hypothetical protein